MSQYIYGGEDTFLGRFGNVTKGQVLDLTDAEAAYVGSDANYAPLPVLSQPTIVEKTGDYTVVNGDSGKLIRTKQSAAIAFALPTSPTLGQNHKFQDAGATGAGTHNITINPGASKVIAGIESSVASIAVSAAGTGLTARPTITITGDGSGATATATMKAVGAVIAGGGTGYSVSDVLTVAGGTQTQTLQLTVTSVNSGVITGVSISQVGSYTALPSNAVAVTGGGGTGATFTITWGINAITVTAGGTGYTTATAAPSTGGGSGATLAVTLAPKTKVVSTNGAQYNVYWNGAKWVEFS